MASIFNGNDAPIPSDAFHTFAVDALIGLDYELCLRIEQLRGPTGQPA
jgi:hypothetical protein